MHKGGVCLLLNVPNVQVSDTTDDHQSDAAGAIKSITQLQNNCSYRIDNSHNENSFCSLIFPGVNENGEEDSICQ